MHDIATKAYLAAIINSSDDAIISKDLNGIITSWNPAAERMYGYCSEEAVGKSITLIIPDDHLDEERENIARLRKGEKIDHFETVRRAKDGSSIYISLTISPIRDENDNIIGASKTARDITEHKKILERQWILFEAGHILGSSLDYKKTLSAVCNLVIPRFADWCALDLFTANEQIQHIEVAHKDPQKVELAREFRRRYPPQENKEGALMRVLRTGEPQIYPEITDELLVKGAKDPEHLAMMRSLDLKSIIIVPLIARGHTLGAMTLVNSESSHRYNANDMQLAMELASRSAMAVENARLFSESRELAHKQEETLQSYRFIQQQLSLLVEASGSLSASLEISSVFEAVLALSSRMVAADAYAVWRLNSSTGEWMVAHAINLSENYQRDVIRIFAETPTLPDQPVIAEDVDELEILQERKDIYSKEGIRSLMAIPLKVRGTANGTLVFYCRTPHKFSQMEISVAIALSNLAASAIGTAELYEELKANDAKKDEFLAMLAHELRNPLAPISNAVHILTTPAASADMRVETGNLIKRQITQMTRLLDDLLDVSRITQGKIELRRARIMLSDVIQTAIETANPLIIERGHTLSIDLPELPVWFNGDATRLSQVFSNLLNNAAKYSDKGKKISIQASQQGDYVTVKVKDNGIGVPQDMQKSIFELFSQVDSSLERSQGGLGIGLTLVKNLVEMHGGTVGIQSEGLGKGSEFTVTLPVIVDATQGKEGHVASKEPFKAQPFRILVVDDNEASGKTLGWMFEMLGHQVQLAKEGNEAMEMAKSFAPEFVFLDIGLPGMNGYQICEAMRRDKTLCNAVIVAQTGWGQEEHLKRSRMAGFDHHLVKPIDIQVLEKLLANVQTTKYARRESSLTYTVV